LNRADLYLILDRKVLPYDKLFEIARKSLKAGIDIMQLRDKSGPPDEVLMFAKKLVRLTHGKIPLIVNDNVDLALEAKASGVHLGQDDMPINEARKAMGKHVLIGISCQTIEQALEAQRHGADYIGFGSVYKTLTKPERSPMDLNYLQSVVKRITIPVFAIGGIDLNNVETLNKLGIKRIAVCRAIIKAKDIKRRVRDFKRLIS